MRFHHKSDKEIFKNNSNIYFSAAKFLPRRVRADIQKLYSFLRVSDDYVDRIPQDLATFKNLTKYWEEFRKKPMSQLRVEKDDSLNLRVVKNICQIKIIHQIDNKLIESYLDAQRFDTVKHRPFKKIEDVIRYMKNSGEAAGLMTARVLELPKDLNEALAYQGRAAQYLGFIRDLKEDLELERSYFAKDDLKSYGFKELTEQSAKENPRAFKEFIREQIKLYRQWQHMADKGILKMPRRLRIAVLTAADMNKWTAKKIYRRPLIVYKKKVRPSKLRIYLTGLSHVFD